MKNKIASILVLLLFFVNFSSLAQEENITEANVDSILIPLVVIFVIITFVSLIGIVLLFTNIMKHKETLDAAELNLPTPPQKFFQYVWSKLNRFDKVHAVENAHVSDYDGIHELDNDLPPWWVALFYITIVFGAVYLFYYHIVGGTLQAKEYEIEIAVSDAKIKAYIKSQPPSVTEDNVEVDNSTAIITQGHAIFKKNCVVCHGGQGQGGVGPNLTDEYWLHGNEISDIFKTIKYGKVEKGMTAWEKKLSPEEIASAANFVFSLKGTNPPNPKAPQGNQY